MISDYDTASAGIDLESSLEVQGSNADPRITATRIRSPFFGTLRRTNPKYTQSLCIPTINKSGMKESALDMVESDEVSTCASTATLSTIDNSVISSSSLSNANPSKPSSISTSVKLGTLQGTFLPCIQQILGVILFLRLPSITAQAGTIGTTLIITMCVLSTFVTSLSLSAIATNGTIQAGGPYYIISRTLGVEIGGALGILFFLGTTLGGGMYVLGAVEAMESFFGGSHSPTMEEVAQVIVANPYEANGSGVTYSGSYVQAESGSARAPGGGVNSDIFEQMPMPQDGIEAEAWFGTTQILSLALMLLVTAVVKIGIRYVNMSSNTFLAIVLLSIFSIIGGIILFAADVYHGNLQDPERIFMENTWPHYTPDPQTGITPSFFSLLALFYPSVTGIMAGCNRSAVLAQPHRSIPLGTISAIVFTTFLYVCLTWLFGTLISHETLLQNKLIVASIAYPNEFLVKIGIILSCVGAALQCIDGAPRLLSAIAADATIPFLKFFQASTTSNGVQAEPTRALYATCFIASLSTLCGNLDHVTPIITIFYLLMYSGINLSCFLLGMMNAPGFRPTFKYFHWSVSLFGFVWCLGLSMVISYYVALGAIGLFVILYKYNKKSTLRAANISNQKDATDANGDNRNMTRERWGDVGDGLRYNITTEALLKLSGTEDFHAKNWRPQLLTIIDTDDVTGVPKHPQLLSLAAQLKKGRGLNMVVSIKHGSFLDAYVLQQTQRIREVLRRHMKEEGMDGFAEVVASSSSFGEAVWSAAIHSGLGPVSPNTVMLAWPNDSLENRGQKADDLVSAIKGIINLKKAVVVFKSSSDTFPKSTNDVIAQDKPVSTIDIWWVVDDGGLLLLLPYMLSKNKIWKNSGTKLRLFAVSTKIGEDLKWLEKVTVEHLRKVRISASVTVIDLSCTEIADDMKHGGKLRNDASLSSSWDMNGKVVGDENVQAKPRTCMSSTHGMTVGEVFASKHMVRNDGKGSDDAAQSSGNNGNNFDVGSGEVIVSGICDDSNKLGKTTITDDTPLTKTEEEMDKAAAARKGSAQIETANAFNHSIKMNSLHANLLVINLPVVDRMKSATDFLNYVDAVCNGMDNVLLVRGSGAEVMTTFA